MYKRQEINLTIEEEKPPLKDRFIKVILPGSKGLNIARDNEEFFVERVFFSPRLNSVAYSGRHLSEKNSKSLEGAEVTIPHGDLVEIPGESKIGLYDIETGQIKEIENE